MKLNRNSFFENQNMMMPQNGFMPNMMPMNNQFYNQNNIDLEERLAKIERQIARLDKRISSLENTSYSTDDINIDSNNMYML